MNPLNLKLPTFDSEIAQIIMAVGIVVYALSHVVRASSRFAPVITALSKMVADHHKRRKEVKPKATTEPINSTTSQIETPPVRFSELVPFSRQAKWQLAGLFIVLTLQIFAPSPASPLTVAVCVLCGAGIVIVFTTIMFRHLVNFLLEILSAILDSNTECLKVSLNATVETTKIILGSSTQK